MAYFPCPKVLCALGQLEIPALTFALYGGISRLYRHTRQVAHHSVMELHPLQSVTVVDNGAMARGYIRRPNVAVVHEGVDHDLLALRVRDDNKRTFIDPCEQLRSSSRHAHTRMMVTLAQEYIDSAARRRHYNLFVDDDRLQQDALDIHRRVRDAEAGGNAAYHR